MVMDRLEERIREIEEEIRRTPVNKGTEAHLARLKAKLARLKEELETQRVKRKTSRSREGVKKTGDATAVIVGPPSVGKSSLLNTLTDAESKIGEYAFTTTTVIPGMLEYGGARIQILDIPGLLGGAADGVGCGREILSYVRMGDVLLIMVDVFTYKQVRTIMKDLHRVGIRINQKPPAIRIIKKDRGSINIFSKVKLTKLDEETIKSILREFKVHNAEIIIEEDIDAERLIDALLGNRAYVKALLFVNKIDMVCKEELEKINRWLEENLPVKMDVVFISVEKGTGLETLVSKIFEVCEFMRIYTKKPGKPANLEEPMILKKGSTVKDVCERIRSDFVSRFKFAKVYGTSVKFDGQKVGLDHVLNDGDIVEVHVNEV